MPHHGCTLCDLNDFAVGQRVKPRPTTDAFYCGEVSGTVESTGRNSVTVRMDGGRQRMFARCNLEQA